ncbi:MAG: type II secretion system F family protein [Methanoregulaceae archaeon]|nr:type II secretion system F family protein [Methanoregulaceae archaeon]
MNLNRMIRSRVTRDPGKYQDLNADLVSARIPMTLERFLWRGFLVSLLAGIVSAAAGYVISGILLSGSSRLTSGLSTITMPVRITLADQGQVFLAQTGAAVLAFLIGMTIAHLLVRSYPGFRKKNRATRINLTLHNAVAYMYAMRKGGAELMVIFRSISENALVYGEVALEFRQIVRDADFFGHDVIYAMRNLMETTPSDKLKQFLEDMVSVIESGGDLSGFLAGRVRMYQDEARFEQKQFLNFLSLVAEAYVTLFVAGPLFLIIIMVVMGMLGSGAVFQMSMTTYALLPLGSAIFIVLIDLISIKTEQVKRYTKSRILREYPDIRIIPGTTDDSISQQLGRYDRIRTIRSILRHPFQSFVNDYRRTLFIAVPAAAAYFILSYLALPPATDFEMYIDLIDDHVVIAILIVLVPYGVFYELWNRRVRKIESLIPDFLERMAGINKVGLTIAQSIAIMVNTNLGLLSYEIRRLKRDMDWGANFSEALIRFEQRISTPEIARSVTLITKASEMSGSIGEVLTIAGSDARMSDALKRDRLSEMFIYTAIVYLAFFVFLFVVVVISSQFLPVLAAITTEGLPVTGVLAGINKVSIQTFGRLMYHTCLVQALFSGMIAGQMGESSLGAGLKHAAIMLAASLIVFNLVL